MEHKKFGCIFIVFSLFILFFVSGPALGEDKDVAAIKEEIRFLRERLLQLEGKMAQQEKIITDQKKTACEVLEKVDVINTRLKGRIEEEGPCWYKTIAVDATLLAVAQGSDGRSGVGDTTDGNIRMQVGFTSTAIKDVVMRLELRQGEGTGLTTKIDAFTDTNGSVYPGHGENIIYEAWYQHRFLGDKASATVGKMDFTNYFDANEVAHCECKQFLASGFIWNPAVEWADNSLGAIISYVPTENLYFRLGATGSNEWEDILSRPFAIAEVGLAGKWPRAGHYRFYTWLNAKHHEKWQDQAAGVNDNFKKGWGAGLSFDQEISDNIALFARAGYQNEDLYKFDVFASFGGRIMGKPWNRPEDSIALAYGLAALSGEYEKFERSVGGHPFISKNESHIELYYRLKVNDRLSITPDFQVLFHPVGDSRDNHIYLGAVRGLVEF